MEVIWTYNSFSELTTAELYNIMQLRNEVFVVEQNCVYQDADNKDQQSFHVSGWDNNHLVAYCRILPPGLAFEEASIGRVVTSPRHRNSGHGRQLVKLAIPYTIQQFNCQKITIGAQLYLQQFYHSFGFTQISNTYLEDGIPHIEMQLTT